MSTITASNIHDNPVPLTHSSKRRWALLATAAAVLVCISPYGSPGIALAMGLAISWLLGNPLSHLVRKASRPLLQGSVVFLGFGMNLASILGAARQGFFLALGTIALTFTVGLLLGKALRLKGALATLLSAGTAICGGSAIAATSLAMEAPQVEISLAMGTVFLLNAIALYLFPLLGHAMGLSQAQFGTWAGLAIHDVSSVVGAASAYGPVALQTATAVKLSRSLWIIPVAFTAGAVARRGAASAGRSSVHVPWFILLFLVASLVGTLVRPVHHVAPYLTQAAHMGMTVTLLLIGLGLSRDSFRTLGIRPLVHGLALWLVIAISSLLAIPLL